MRRTQVLLPLVLIAAGLLLRPGHAASAVAHVRATPGNTQYASAGGVVSIAPKEGAADTLVFAIALAGFPPDAELAVHVHEYGDVSGTDTQGAHFNPLGAPHGCADSAIRHVGDLGNVRFDAAGAATTTIETALPSLDATLPQLVVGRAIVVHAARDNCTGPAGFAGARLAHGVIGWNVTATAAAGSGVGAVAPGTQMVCVLSPIGAGSSGPSGNVTFRQRDDGKVDVLLFVQGLAPGSEHGVHIHEFGNIGDRDAGLAAGTHVNPDGVDHGCPDVSSAHHTGDLGSHKSDGEGRLFRRVVVAKPAIRASNMHSILGRALIVHEKADDCATVASAGKRLAQCVIGTSQQRTFALDSDDDDDDLPGGSDSGDGASGWFSIEGWGIGVLVFVLFLVGGAAVYLLLRWRLTMRARRYGLVSNVDDDGDDADALNAAEFGDDIVLDEVYNAATASSSAGEAKNA